MLLCFLFCFGYVRREKIPVTKIKKKKDKKKNEKKKMKKKILKREERKEVIVLLMAIFNSVVSSPSFANYSKKKNKENKICYLLRE